MKYPLTVLLLLSWLQTSAQFNLNNSNLVAYYPLNGNFLDYSGNGYHGTAYGSPNFTTDKWSSGNSAIQLDGINDWIELPVTDFVKHSFTLVFRMKADTLAGGFIFCKTRTSGAYTQFRIDKHGNSTTIGYEINCSNSACVQQVWLSHGIGSVGLNQWKCVVFSYDRSSATSRLVILDQTGGYWNYSAGALMDTCSAGSLRIGRQANGNNTYFKGAIDEVRIYNTNLLSGTTSAGLLSSAASLFTPYCDSLDFVMQPVPTKLCRGMSLSVGYNGAKALSGNNIIVQLSNASGSFASPTVIGSVGTTNASGFVNCTIPISTPLGTSYRIRVVSTNIADTSDDNGFNLSVSEYPAVAASNPISICEGSTINLSATVTPTIVPRNWTGPLSFTSTQQNPTIANAPTTASGNYIIEADYNGCITKDTVQVTVNPYPSTPAAGSNSPICEGSMLNLTSTIAGSGANYSWSGPGSFTSNIQNPSISNTQLSANGDYVVTADINGCTRKDTVTVLVKLMPVVPTTGSNSPVCSGNSLNLTASSTTSGVAYDWTGPLSYTSTTQNPMIANTTTSMSGTYNVTATLNGCTSAAGTTNITVNLTPATPTATSNTPVCAGGILNLSANSATPGVSYNWIGPNGFASTAQNPIISPVPLSANGAYNVTAELNGCTSTGSGSTTVVVNNVSSLGVYPSPNDTLCANNTNASFVAVPFNAGTAPQYQWYKNNNLLGGATNITYPAAGIADGDSFYCRMTVTGLCADPLVLYSNKVGMTVLPLTSGPSVSITADPGTLLSPWQLVKFTAVASNAGALPKYQWKRNSQDVIGANSNVWSANNLSNGDTISCLVTSDVWCASPANAMSNRMVVNIKLGIEDLDADDGLKLYPNPNNGSFIIHIPLPPFEGGNVRVDVVDALGRVVYANYLPIAIGTQITTQKLEIALPASVANGVYLLKLSADGMVYHARFTVSR